jgi:hypothetical protein
MYRFIAIIGYDDCGKDTTAKLLKKKLAEKMINSKITSFAYPLKGICSELLGVSIDELEEMKKNNDIVYLHKKQCTTRDFIIQVASSLRKHFGDNLFAKHIATSNHEEDFIIVPDMRFLVEYETLRTHGGILVVRLDSNLDNCGKNGKKYDVDYIEHDCVIRNEKGNMGILEKDIEKLVNKIEKDIIKKKKYRKRFVNDVLNIIDGDIESDIIRRR